MILHSIHRQILEYQDLDQIDFGFVNMITMYLLSKLANSQSMSFLTPRFKHMKGARMLLAKMFPALPDADPPLARIPYITCQTVSYALSIVVSTVCHQVSNIMIKGHTEKLY